MTHAVDLEQGPHPISISYSHHRGRYGIKLRASIDGEPWTPVSAQDLAPRIRSSLTFRFIERLEALAEMVAASWIAIEILWLIRRVPTMMAIGLGRRDGGSRAGRGFRPTVVDPQARPVPRSMAVGYHPPDTWYRVGPALFGAAVIIGTVVFLSVGGAGKRSRARGRARLTTAMLGGPLLQLGVLHLGQAAPSPQLAR